MKTADIAKTIIERRMRMSPIVYQAEMLEALGSDGLKEALDRRWLIPNYESGYLQITNDESLVASMHQAVTENENEKDEEGKEDSDMEKKERTRAQGEHDRAKADACDDGPMEESALRTAIANHANRRIGEDMYGGSFMGAPASTAKPSATPPSAPAGTPARNGRDVGSDVTVVENGHTFQGKVSAKTDDGKYKVSFSGQRPAQERDYEETELGATQ